MECECIVCFNQDRCICVWTGTGSCGLRSKSYFIMTASSIDLWPQRRKRGDGTMLVAGGFGFSAFSRSSNAQLKRVYRAASLEEEEQNADQVTRTDLFKLYAARSLHANQVHSSVLSYRDARPDSQLPRVWDQFWILIIRPTPHSSSFQKFSSALFRCSIFSLSELRGSTQTGAVSRVTGRPRTSYPLV